jgi:glycosyltransferase involved in cell wall biosynthesis
MKILHAPVSIGNIPFRISRAQRLLGYESDVTIFYPNPFIDYVHWDRCIDPKRYYGYLKNFIECLAKYDVFNFHCGESLLSYNIDLPIIKCANKKIVMQYWGSDARRLSVASKRNKYTLVKNPHEKNIIMRLRMHSLFVDAVVVGDHELYENVDGFFKRIEVVRVGVDLENFRVKLPMLDISRPIIAHAPSSRGFKGTEFVLDAVKSLESEGYDFEFMLIENTPYTKALQIYEKADIVIDQLRTGVYGMLSIEAMAMGKPVLCYIRDDLFSKYPPGLPILSSSPDNIYDNLKLLVENPELRIELGKKGREYVERVHDSRKIARQLIELYKSL